MPFLLPLDLQFFAEEPPAEPVEPDTTPDNPEPKMYDEEYVKKLRDEAAKYRKRAKDMEGQTQTEKQDMLKKVFEAFGIDPDPNLEFEKQLSAAQRKAQEAVQVANDKLVKAEIKAVGTELGMNDPLDAYAFVDKDSFEVKEDGTVEGIKEALEKLVSEKPYLLRASSDESPKPNSYNPGPDQKGNNPKPPDKYQVGVTAYERLKQKGRIR